MTWIPTIILALIILSIWLFYPKKRKTEDSSIHHPEWKKILASKVNFYQKLEPIQKVRFEEKVFSFIQNYKITGVDLTLTEEDKVFCAASAIIPVFGFPNWEYTNLNEVLLYPNSFNQHYETDGEERNILGMVGWGVMNRTMILSQSALHSGFENEHSKTNVGIHEFMHLIDKSDGAVDGVPEVIMSKQYVIPWLNMMHQEMKKIRTNDSDINPYGATSEAEFFSVVGEYFFNQPERFEKNHPEMYQLLEAVFQKEGVISKAKETP